MRRLAGFHYHEIVKRLKLFGFAFDLHAVGSHEIWHNQSKNLYTTILNHASDIPERTLRAILKQAHITPNESLKKIRSRPNDSPELAIWDSMKLF